MRTGKKTGGKRIARPGAPLDEFLGEFQGRLTSKRSVVLTTHSPLRTMNNNPPRAAQCGNLLCSSNQASDLRADLLPKNQRSLDFVREEDIRVPQRCCYEHPKTRIGRRDRFNCRHKAQLTSPLQHTRCLSPPVVIYAIQRIEKQQVAK